MLTGSYNENYGRRQLWIYVGPFSIVLIGLPVYALIRWPGRESLGTAVLSVACLLIISYLFLSCCPGALNSPRTSSAGIRSSGPGQFPSAGYGPSAAGTGTACTSRSTGRPAGDELFGYVNMTTEATRRSCDDSGGTPTTTSRLLRGATIPVRAGRCQGCSQRRGRSAGLRGCRRPIRTIRSGYRAR